MDFHGLAIRVAFSQEAARRKPKRKVNPKRKPVAKPKKRPVQNILAPQTEYSCQLDVSITADFEGNTTKSKLTKVLKSQVVKAIQAGVVTTSRELGIQATNILIKPLDIQVAVNDSASIEDDDDIDL